MTAQSDIAARTGVPITISNVSKAFGEGTGKPFQALKPIDVTIPAGEFISVVGASGCGKSTLMLMVAGLLKRSSGEITVAAGYGCRHRLSGSSIARFSNGVRERHAPR